MQLQAQYEIVILGAGPAGISAALTVSDTINHVLLVDKKDTVGGHLSFHDRPLVGVNWSKESVTGEEWCHLKSKELIDTGLELCLETTVEKIDKDGNIHLRKNNKSSIIKASIIIASLGSKYVFKTFPGRDLKGIFTIKTAQETINKFRQELPSPIFILGGNSAAFDVGLTCLEKRGSSQITICEQENQILADPKKVNLFINKGGKILKHTQILSAFGENKIQLISTIKKHGDNYSEKMLMPASTLILSPWRTPAISLLENCGCDMTNCQIFGGTIPRHNQNYRTTNPKIYAVGDVIGVENGSVAIEQGIVSGLMSMKALGKPHGNHQLILSRSMEVMKSLHSHGFSLERKIAREEIMSSNLIAR